MNSKNLKIILRSVRKQKLSSLLSVLVLTIGMASFMLIFFFISYEKSYDESGTNPTGFTGLLLKKLLKTGT